MFFSWLDGGTATVLRFGVRPFSGTAWVGKVSARDGRTPGAAGTPGGGTGPTGEVGDWRGELRSPSSMYLARALMEDTGMAKPFQGLSVLLTSQGRSFLPTPLLGFVAQSRWD